jgi:hypothetical protein
LLQTTSVDFDLTIEEKIFRSLKRLCTIFAVGAVTLCLLDVINIRSVDAAVEFLHDSSARIVELPNRVVELPDRIRSEIRNISIMPPSSKLPPSLSAQATASIPVGKPIVLASAPAGLAASPAVERVATSPKADLAADQAVATLAAVHDQDAVEWAMAAHPLPAATSAPVAAKPAVLANLAPQPVETPKPDVDLWTKAKPETQPEAAAKPDAQPETQPVAADKPAAMNKAEAKIEAKSEAKTEGPSAALIKPDLPVSLAPAPARPVSAPAQMAAADPAPALQTSIAPTLVSLPMSAAIPIDMVPLPRPAPGAPPPSPAERLHLEGKDFAKAERCLANAVYFEARSEPVRGQMAVAQVVINRAFSGFYPADVCGVVYQNADHYLGCQFTFACDGKRKLINERGAWARANRIAKQTLEGLIYVPEVAKSTHYHAVYVHPNWVREMHRMVRYGEHAFYRPIAWGNGADEPVWGSAALAQNKKK